MRPMQRLVSAAVLIALSSALTGCGSITGWDPSDLLDFLDTKKKLPGDRKPVFPEGVPGLEQGVPKELYKDNVEREQREQQQQLATPAAPPPAAEAPKGRKSKGRVSVGTVQQGAAPADAAPTEEGAPAAVPEAPKGRKIVRRRTTAPPPDEQPAAAPAQQAPAASQSALPAPVPSGTFSR